MSINSTLSTFIPKLFSREDLQLNELANAIKNNQDFSNQNLEVKKDELGPKIRIKAKDEDGIINAVKQLTKVYKQNPNLKSKIYLGLKLEENSDKLLTAYLASESELLTPSRNGERSFGHNLIADKILYKLREIDRKINKGITIEINNKKEENEDYSFLDSIKKHKKAIATLAATAALGSCIVYPSLIKGKITFDPYLTLNHLTQAIQSINPILLNNLISSNLRYVAYAIPAFKIDEDGQKKKSRKILKCGLLGLTAYEIGDVFLGLPGLFDVVEATYLFYNLRPFESDIGKWEWKEVEGEWKWVWERGSEIEWRWKKAFDIALKTNDLDSLKGFLGFGSKITEFVHFYNELGRTNVDKLWDFISTYENRRELIYYFKRFKSFIPEVLGDLSVLWNEEEIDGLGWELIHQLRGINRDKRKILEYLFDSKRVGMFVNSIKRKVIENPYGDADKDGFNNITELMNERNPVNPLEYPGTNRSEVYIITLNGSGGGYYAPDLEVALILRYYALKYGIPADHIKSFGRIYIEGPRWHGNPLLRVSPRRPKYFPEIKGYLLKDYPLKIDYLDDECTKENFLTEVKKALQLADSNDVVYIHNSGEGPGFKISDSKGNYVMIPVLELNKILASNQGKIILVNDTCGAEGYVESLHKPIYLPVKPLKDFVGIGAVRRGESSSGEFEFIFVSKLRDGYSIKDAIPSETKDGHPVIYKGEGDYSWIDTYNIFS